ncbi:MAG: zinc ribbon domain-containing protein [Paracoccaceae bacterium]|nr:zinc ribbon domain-containing protein [Paracoccaceae bacterium]
MSDLVSRKLDVIENADPMGRGPDDPWRDFRTVERLDMELHFQFKHSFGKLSPFFLALEERRLMGTRCTECGKVWMPPRVHCGDDLAICEWVELPGEGVLEAASLSAYTLTTGGGEDTLVLGYVTLDGADAAMLQQVRNCDSPAPGLRVKAVWAERPVEHPMQLFWFEPA